MHYTFPYGLTEKQPRCKGCVPFRANYGRIRKVHVATQSCAEPALEVRSERGGFGQHCSGSGSSTPSETGSYSRPGGPGTTEDNRVVTSLRPLSFDHSGRRRRHSPEVFPLERPFQQCVDVTLDVLEQEARSHVSAEKSTNMLGNRFSLNRIRCAWKSARKPTEGKLALYTETTIKPREKRPWKMMTSRKGGTPPLESRCAEFPAEILQIPRCLQPTVANDRSRQPLPYFPRTSTRSNATRYQCAPQRCPNLYGVLTTLSTTRNRPSRSPTTCYFRNRYRRA